MGDQTSLVSRQEREANAKNQPMFRKRLFKDILIAISGSFRTGTSNTACCMMSSPWLPFTLTMGKLRKRAQQNIPEDNVLPPVVTSDPRQQQLACTQGLRRYVRSHGAAATASAHLHCLLFFGARRRKCITSLCIISKESGLICMHNTTSTPVTVRKY